MATDELAGAPFISSYTLFSRFGIGRVAGSLWDILEHHSV